MINDNINQNKNSIKSEIILKLSYYDIFKDLDSLIQDWAAFFGVFVQGGYPIYVVITSEFSSCPRRE